jgi:D-alanyl-lipoteichoic acid acyltransferase DltB (MBOAT superfamily)
MVYLIGVYFYGDGRSHRSFVNYCLFVSFFPHLLAGPILYHKDMMEQFDDVSKRHLQWENIARGMSLFVIGLFKKVIIADGLIVAVSNGFSHADQITLVSGWVAALSFFFQMYYDFSGYTDMAVGVAKMMNIDIPINFNSPFHSKNLIEFWSRWHISLTSTITAYIYTPLVMSFKKVTLAKSIAATFITMVIIGIWHGAGWTYVVFGAVHGIALGINSIWKRHKLPMPRCLSRAITLLFVAVTCVLFRATSLENAGDVFLAMIGQHGVVWPGHIGADILLSLHSPVFMGLSWVIVVLAVLGVSFGPNSNEFAGTFKPNRYWAAVLAAVFVFAVLHFTQVTEFLYFQF